MEVSDQCLIALNNQQSLRALEMRWSMLHSGQWNTLFPDESETDQTNSLICVQKMLVVVPIL
jgi:hypothetical protein